MLPVHTSLDMRLNMAVMTTYMDTVSWLTVNNPYRKQKMPTRLGGMSMAVQKPSQAK